MNQRQRTIFDETVSSRIESLLARCDRLRRGSDVKHTRFDARGEREAQAIARADAEREANTPRMGSNLRASPSIA